jgi:hypothetical protein
MHAKEEWISERFFDGGMVQRQQGVEQRRNGRGRCCKGGKESSKRGTGNREIDPWTAELYDCGKGSNSGGTGGSERFIDGGTL